MINKYDESKSFDYENGFYLTSQPFRLGNILAHYELYKRIINLPGDVIELGVFKGGSIIQFATFRELLENENSRKIIGFDIFGEFPQSDTVKSDRVFIENFARNNGKYEFLTKDEIYKSLDLKKIHNVELVQGDICNTLAQYLEKNPQIRISLLHIDTDVYEPAKVGLELLFNRVVTGGVVIFDDYAVIEGETLAVDEFLSDKDYMIEKYSFSHSKPCYIIKK